VSFYQVMREARLEQGMTQKTLAQALEVPQPTMCDWETGRRKRINVNTLALWAKILGVDVVLDLAPSEITSSEPTPIATEV